MKRKMSPEEEKAFRAKLERIRNYSLRTLVVVLAGIPIMVMAGNAEEYENIYTVVGVTLVMVAALVAALLPMKEKE